MPPPVAPTLPSEPPGKLPPPSAALPPVVPPTAPAAPGAPPAGLPPPPSVPPVKPVDGLSAPHAAAISNPTHKPSHKLTRIMRETVRLHLRAANPPGVHSV